VKDYSCTGADGSTRSLARLVGELGGEVGFFWGPGAGNLGASFLMPSNSTEKMSTG